MSEKLQCRMSYYVLRNWLENIRYISLKERSTQMVVKKKKRAAPKKKKKTAKRKR